MDKEGKQIRIAVVAQAKDYLNNELFNLNNKSLNRDNSLKFFTELRKLLLSNNIQIETIDRFPSLKNVDYVLFFTLDLKWYRYVYFNGKANKSIYIALEPEVVDTHHSKSGMQMLLKLFRYIFTWNDDFIDNENIFKISFPYFFNTCKKKTGFEDKKLLVNISANKYSKHPDELYSERYKIIKYCDGKDYFELYGRNWEKELFKSYKGTVSFKNTVYNKFRFALCLENMKNVNGYITEKILDCFCAGIVPVYYGAANIEKYIPETCYIKYDKFKSPEQLINYLSGISKEEYNNYLVSIQNYLNSKECKEFSPDNFYNTLMKIIKSDSINESVYNANFIIYYKYCIESLMKKLHLKEGGWSNADR